MVRKTEGKWPLWKHLRTETKIILILCKNILLLKLNIIISETLNNLQQIKLKFPLSDSNVGA